MLSGTTLAQEEVLHLDIGLFADFNYDVNEFNVREYIEDGSPFLFADDDEFVDEFPIFENKDFLVNGFGSLGYDIYSDIASDFDINEKYNWEIFVDAEWGHDIEFQIPGGTDFDDNYDFFYDEQYIDDISVNDVTFDFLGLSPDELVDEILTYLAPLSSAGTLFSLINELNTFNSANINWPLESIDPATIDYYTEFGPNLGYIDVVLNQPFSVAGIVGPSNIDMQLASLISANAGGYAGIHISAVRVPDAGTTGLLAFASLGALLAAKRRFSA